jgi:hypothetical protein
MTDNIRGHAELSQYEILSLFVAQYILGSRNMILNYTRVTRSMSCVQYIHMIVITERFRQIT